MSKEFNSSISCISSCYCYTNKFKPEDWTDCKNRKDKSYYKARQKEFLLCVIIAFPIAITLMLILK